MKLIHCLLILSICTMNLSCEKSDETEINILPADTLFPLPYFPSYPGSWWEYINRQGDTVTVYSDSSYQLFSMPYSHDRIIYETKPVYAPVWNKKFLIGYCIPEFNEMIPIISTQLDSEWVTVNVQSPPYSILQKRQVANIDTSIVVNSVTYNNVIKIVEMSFHGNTFNVFRTNFYAMDIGLIKNDTAEILNYHINH